MTNNIQSLYGKIAEANRAYRNGAPIMTDLAYDALVDKLKRIDPDNDWFKKTEPGMDSVDGRKVQLPFPMKSLDKVKTMGDLKLWTTRSGLSSNDLVTITPKFDGISLLCDEKSLMTYSRGGSENEGMDCLEHMVLMKNVKHDVRFPYTFGEAIINKKNWEDHFKGKINPFSGLEFKSARNTVSGLFRQDNPSEDLLQFVDFVRYGVFGIDLNKYGKYSSLLEVILSIYGCGPDYVAIKVGDLDGKKMEELFYEWSDKYAIDGLVVYIDNLLEWDRVGRNNSTGNPRWAIAYKPEEFCGFEITKVLAVNCKISKSGHLKPTVAVEAVELDGATIDNPTGVNARFCVKNGIGKGAVVKLIRSGMVIPKIVETIVPADEETVMKAFDRCPSCGKKAVWNESMTDMACPDPNCPGTLLAKLIYFCDKIGYDDIGEEILEMIFEAGIKKPSDFIHLDLNALLGINGMQNSWARKIASRNKEILDNGLPLHKLVEVSDIFQGIGEKKAIRMFSNLHTDIIRRWLWEGLDRKDIDKMMLGMLSVKGVGESIIREFFNKQEDFLCWFHEIGIPVRWNDDKRSGGPLSGYKICFTGVRDKDAERYIVKNGGEVISSVTKNTTLLIVKEFGTQSTKTSKATALGVRTMTLDEFKKVNHIQ